MMMNFCNFLNLSLVLSNRLPHDVENYMIARFKLFIMRDECNFIISIISGKGKKKEREKEASKYKINFTVV